MKVVEMTMQNEELHSWLSSKAAAVASWVSAFLGLGTAVGVVNLIVGVLSAAWLAAQLWNWWTFTLPKNKREKASWAVTEKNGLNK